MKIWTFIAEKLQVQQRTVLLYVLDNAGSSPGRKGFKMAVAEDGTFVGTIGGGMMEVKLLELAKNKLQKQDFSILIKQQYHDKKHKNNQSGLICSGEQTVAIVPLSTDNLSVIQLILAAKGQKIRIGLKQEGIDFISTQDHTSYQAILHLPNAKRVHILGGGHVGLALSQVLNLLNYEVLIYDNRPNLNTLKENQFAHHIQLVDYQKATDYINLKKEDALIFVTFSYRSDKLLLKQFYRNKCLYMGMMGSPTKIKTLWAELATEGISKDDLTHVFAPIGLPIYSKTTMEIAISIAGQMILECNKHLPSGRN